MNLSMTPHIRLTLLLLLCVAGPTAKAQQDATVKSFIMTTDHIPGDYRRNDLNKVPCALVKVHVLDDIVRVDGNMIGDVINRGVEKWIYLCKGTKQMRIHLKNHMPVTIVLKDYKITPLESNRVYELVINTPSPETIDMTDVKGSHLRMRVVPKDAVVVIWGDNMHKRMEYPRQDGSVDLYVPYGRFYYFVEAYGYERKDGDLFVNDEDRVEEVRLVPITGDLIVKCNTKADIFVNGVLVDYNKKTKSWTGKYPAGRYIIEARAKGFIPIMRRIEILSGREKTVEFGDMTSENDMKKKGLTLFDEAALLKDSVEMVRQQTKARLERQRRDYIAKIEAMKRANTYDVIKMRDGSIILCTVNEVGDKMIQIRQKIVDGFLNIPIQQVQSIEYSNGVSKVFTKK